MSGERFILVETLRFFGRMSWARRVCDAGAFDTEEEALAAYAREFGEPLDRRSQGMRVRRVVPAGTKRDTVATLRAELDGLRATDEEMAAKLAAVTAERDEARSDLARASVSAVAERMRLARAALSATQGETVDEAAQRAVAEWDAAVRDLAELRRAIEVLIAQARPAA